MCSYEGGYLKWKYNLLDAIIIKKKEVREARLG